MTEENNPPRPPSSSAKAAADKYQGGRPEENPLIPSYKGDSVRIFDTTLRDGEQSPGYSMTTSEKLRLAVQLERLGVDVIEAGFPIASKDDFAAVEAIAKKLKQTEVCGLARAMEGDIRAAYEATKHAAKSRIHTFVATSDVHMEYKLKKTKEQVKEMTRNAVRLAKSLCDRVDFSPEDAGRSDKHFLKEVIDIAIAEGADVINIPDTVGYLMPSEFGELISFLIRECEGGDRVIFSTHCHNDLGLAVANSLAGVAAGARQVECTMNGIGERAGNASLEEVVMAIKTRPHFYNIDTNIKTTEIMATSKLLQKITGQRVQPNKAIVGRNAFAHESGIHQHGFLSKRETYEILKPEDVGLAESQIVLGKHSGRAALKSHLEKLGYEVNDEEKLKELFVRFKDLADRKKEIEDADLDMLMLGKAKEERLYTLTDIEVHAGTTLTPRAEVVLQTPEGEQRASAEGTGPVDAAYKAIESLLGKHGEITNFQMDAVTDGLDAQAIVSLTLKTADKQRFFGKAANTDIVVASAKAYVSAVDNCLRRKGKADRFAEEERGV